MIYLAIGNKRKRYLVIVLLFLLIQGCVFVSEPQSDSDVILIEYVDNDFWDTYKYRMININGDGYPNLDIEIFSSANIAKDSNWVVGYIVPPPDRGIFIENLEEKREYRIDTYPNEVKWSPAGENLLYFDADGLIVADVSCIIFPQLNCEEIKKVKYNVEGWSPDWSFNGAQVIYYIVNDDSVFGQYQILDLKTNEIQTLTISGYINCGRPDWSPNEDKILFACQNQESKFYEILIFNIYSNSFKSIAQYQYETFFNPSWSPDGTQIAYVSKDDDDLHQPVGEFEDQSNALYIMDVDGSNVKRITFENDIEILNINWWAGGCRFWFRKCTD